MENPLKGFGPARVASSQSRDVWNSLYIQSLSLQDLFNNDKVKGKEDGPN